MLKGRAEEVHRRVMRVSGGADVIPVQDVLPQGLVPAGAERRERQRRLGGCGEVLRHLARVITGVLHHRLVRVQVQRHHQRPGAIRRGQRPGLPAARAQPQRGVQQLRLGRREPTAGQCSVMMS
jgi:hypothetical protein